MPAKLNCQAHAFLCVIYSTVKRTQLVLFKSCLFFLPEILAFAQNDSSDMVKVITPSTVT